MSGERLHLDRDEVARIGNRLPPGPWHFVGHRGWPTVFGASASADGLRDHNDEWIVSALYTEADDTLSVHAVGSAVSALESVPYLVDDLLTLHAEAAALRTRAEAAEAHSARMAAVLLALAAGCRDAGTAYANAAEIDEDDAAIDAYDVLASAFDAAVPLGDGASWYDTAHALRALAGGARC